MHDPLAFWPVATFHVGSLLTCISGWKFGLICLYRNTLKFVFVWRCSELHHIMFYNNARCVASWTACGTFVFFNWMSNVPSLQARTRLYLKRMLMRPVVQSLQAPHGFWLGSLGRCVPKRVTANSYIASFQDRILRFGWYFILDSVVSYFGCWIL